MKKIFIIFIMLFLLTGCDVEYNINLTNDDKIHEEFNVFLDKNVDDESNVEYLLNYEPYAILNKDEFKKYNKEIVEEDSLITGKYSYTYYISDYKSSQLFKKCYDLSGIKQDDKYYYISTSGKFHCLVYDYIPVDKITINFETDYVVSKHNADYVENHIYTWVIDDSNFENKPINIVVDKTKIEVKKEDNFDGIKILTIVTGIVFTIGIIIVLIIKFIGSKKNKL